MRWKRGSRLKLVSEDEAPRRVREIFDEVRQTLGLPVVPALYRAYAAFPQFLEVHWQSFHPILRSRQFFMLGARLAAESYTRGHNYFGIPSLTTYGTPAMGTTLQIPQVLDYYQYADPLLLLITAGQMQAFEGPVGNPCTPEPVNHPTFQVAPCLLSDLDARQDVQSIWDERRRILELAFTSDEHRALACWPDFYRQYWNALKDLLQSPLYADCQYRIGESAWTMVRELPGTTETGISQLIDAGLESEEISSVARINEAFMQAMTGLVLDITFARIACDGGTTGHTPLQNEATVTAKKKRAGSPTRAA
ncbi:MAG TPA: halocarboxylic acid dehydrogenase DehI family protein [Verrucomicrobiae bacterium]|jgi:hypothetical protein|nr:halocarboxylic acid dehydrogenase DehI family protein [Verrucomicrobiae bacterium]